MMKETKNGRRENVIPASAVYVPQPGGAAKPLDTVLSSMPAKQAAAVGERHHRSGDGHHQRFAGQPAQRRYHREVIP